MNQLNDAVLSALFALSQAHGVLTGRCVDRKDMGGGRERGMRRVEGARSAPDFDACSPKSFHLPALSALAR